MTESVAGASASSSTTLVSAFASSIKKDLTHYPVLKKDTDYLDWHAQFVSLATLHEVYSVVDPVALTDPRLPC